MGFQGLLLILTTALSLTKDLGVSAQYATVVECVPQATATIARPIVQTPPVVLPAVIQPIITSYDPYGLDLCSGYGNPYGNFPAPFAGPMPPIIIEEDNNIWNQLLYFLIFALSNKRACAYNTPPCYGCGCTCNCGCRGTGNCNCGCSCGCSNSKNNVDTSSSTASTPTYIPIPIAIPFFSNCNSGCPFMDSNSCFPNSDDIIIQTSAPDNGRETNEINLIIRAEA